jgi:hypothetical protein
MTNSQIVLAVMIPVVVWRLYSRYRKLVGKQHVRPAKLWMSATLFPLLFVLIAFGSLANQTALVCLIGGGVAGVCLSVLGHRLTRYENTAGVLSYTPNATIGLTLLLILSGRIGFRFFQMADAAQQQGQAGMQALTNSPLTTLILGLLMCYYASYSIGILRWRNGQLKTAPQAAPPQASD